MLLLIKRFAAAIARLVRSRLAPSPARAPRDLPEALAAMPVFVREVYLLRRVDKLTHVDIALRLGISPRTVRRLLREAVRILASGS